MPVDESPQLVLHALGQRVDRMPHLDVVDVAPNDRPREVDLARGSRRPLDPRIAVLRQDHVGAKRPQADIPI
jgi:hypothetical protein